MGLQLGYRVTQGLHVTTGTAAIPLPLVKLWTVFPQLVAAIQWRRPKDLLLQPPGSGGLWNFSGSGGRT